MPRAGSFTRADFKLATARQFKRIRGVLFSVSYGTLRPGGGKVACVVPKKAASRAVDRNLIKRRCRAAAREALSPAESLSFIFYANARARGASFADIRTDIRALVEKAR